MFKKIISAVLVVVMMFSLTLCLFACKENENNENNNNNNQNTTPEKVTYIVTVVDTDGNPVKGVEVTFAPQGSMAIPFDTDVDGKTSFKSDKEMSISVTKIPSGYSYDNLNKALTIGADGNVIVTLTKLAPFVIKVVDQDGNAISGVRVQMCDEAGSCRLPKTTGADGTASYPHEEGIFHAQLTEIPDGYTVDDPAQYYNFEDGVATIVVTKI